MIEPTPVASYGPRERSWLHPSLPYYVDLYHTAGGRVVGGGFTRYCRDRAEAEAFADQFMYRNARPNQP